VGYDRLPVSSVFFEEMGAADWFPLFESVSFLRPGAAASRKAWAPISFPFV